MTFEQWWESKFKNGIPSDPIYAPMVREIKADFAQCWNEALETAASEPWKYDFAVPRVPSTVLSQILYEINRAARTAIRKLKTT